MQIVVHSPLIAPVALAAMHGTTDLALPPHRLAPYALSLFWPSVVPVSGAFIAASAVHFARDVGWGASVFVHAVFVAGAMCGHADDVFVLFALYFCLVHTPMHYARHAHAWVWPLLCTALCAAALCVFDMGHTLVFEDWMQRIVVAHIVCDEMGRLPPRDMLTLNHPLNRTSCSAETPRRGT